LFVDIEFCQEVGGMSVTELSIKRESKFDDLYGFRNIAVSWAIQTRT